MAQDKDTIDDLQNEIVEDFTSIGDPLSQYELLLQVAASLPTLDDALKIDENLVKGCQSQVWLILGAEDGRLSMVADSDTLIVRGILSLLITVLDGQPFEDVAASDIRFIGEADLMLTFNDERRKGIGTIIGNIKRFAADHVG